MRLTDTIVRGLPAPERGNKVTYDDAVKGFGARVTANGARSFVLNYRARGIERRLTIGSYPDWRTTEAREEARLLRQEVDRGGDPLLERRERREAPTVADLADRYRAEHLPSKRERPRRGRGYAAAICLASARRPQSCRRRTSRRRKAASADHQS